MFPVWFRIYWRKYCHSIIFVNFINELFKQFPSGDIQSQQEIMFSLNFPWMMLHRIAVTWFYTFRQRQFVFKVNIFSTLKCTGNIIQGQLGEEIHLWWLRRSTLAICLRNLFLELTNNNRRYIFILRDHYVDKSELF